MIGWWWWWWGGGGERVGGWEGKAGGGGGGEGGGGEGEGGGEDDDDEEEEEEENTYLFYPAINSFRRIIWTEKIAPVSVPGLNHLDTTFDSNVIEPILSSEIKNISWEKRYVQLQRSTFKLVYDSKVMVSMSQFILNVLTCMRYY